MLLDPDLFAKHLAHAPEGGVRDAFLIFAHADYPGGLTARPTSKGFIDHDLRIEGGGNWYFSAVLNQGWVLWYFRKPAFRDGLAGFDATRAAFPDSKVSPSREITLRVRNAEAARAVIDHLNRIDSSAPKT